MKIKMLWLLFFSILISHVFASEFRFEAGNSKTNSLDFRNDEGFTLSTGYIHRIADQAFIQISYAYSKHDMKAPYGHSYVDGDLHVQANMHSLKLGILFTPLSAYSISNFLSPYYGGGFGGRLEQYSMNPSFDPFNSLHLSGGNAVYWVPDDPKSAYISFNTIGIEILSNWQISPILEREWIYNDYIVPLPGRKPADTLWRVGFNINLRR